ncbi:SUMO1 sentrin specific peptidase 8 [Homalodisca vitripennis]|nr:SUMO1 sentrin specific peptidase 8 [Homalodisca vitripennis]
MINNEEILFTSETDDDLQICLISLTSELNALMTNYPELDFTNLSMHISDLLNKIDKQNSSYKCCLSDLTHSSNELQLLSPKLDLEKEQRRNEMNNSFKILDESNVEIVDLKKQVQSLFDELRQRELNISTLIAENNTLSDDVRSIKAKLLLSSESNEKNDLTIKNLSYKLDLLTAELSVNSISDKKCSSYKWVEEHIISDYFSAIANSVKGRDEILLFNLAVSHLLKVGTPEAINDTLSNSTFNNAKYVFLCVNNSVDKQRADSGTHWSLLFIDRGVCKAYHIDSVLGVNLSSAVNILRNLNVPQSSLVEIKCQQQANDFECGLNVIVNAKFIVNYYCSPRRKEEFTDWFYCNVVTLPDCPSPALNSVIPSSTPSHNQSQSSPPQLDNNTHTTSCKVDTVKLVRCKGDKWKLVKSNSKRKRSKQTKLPRQEVSIECGNKYVVLSDIDVDDCTELNTTPGVCGTSKPAKELSVISHSSVSVTDRNQPKEKNIHANKSNVSDSPLTVNDISCNENLSCNELPLKSCLIIGDSLLRYSGKQCSDLGATIDMNPGARIRTIKQKLMSYLILSSSVPTQINAHKDETQSFEPGTPEPDTPTAPETKPYTPEPEPDTPALTSGNDSTPHPNPPS